MNIERFKDRKRKDEDLAEEIDSHLAHEQDANAARGLPREEAHRQAHLKFGNPRTTRERVWQYRSIPWIEDLWRDLRFVLRSLAKTPGFTAIAIIVIAVGIGVNTAVFSVINTVLLKPLTYPDPQSLVQLMNTFPQGSNPVRERPQVQCLASANQHLPAKSRLTTSAARDSTSPAAIILSRCRASTSPPITLPCSAHR